MSHRFPALIAAPDRGRGRLWLTGARLFDGTGGAVRDGAAVLVEDGVIRQVGDASQPCPPGPRRLDVGGRVLMPGLTDAHTHAAGRSPQVPRGAEEVLAGTAAHFLQAELRGYLRAGVTTIRVTGSQGLMPQEARQAMRYGAFRGPRRADLREDHLGDGAGRAVLRRHVPGGRRPRRHAAGGPGADPGRGRLRQGDDDRRPLQRAGGSRPGPADRAGTGGGGR